MSAISAAGFMAMSTLGASPGVVISWSEMCTWKLDTPLTVPAGARISAGKSGNVDRSLPKMALDEVNRSPVSCMPSPESPAKRTTTRVIVSAAGFRSTVSVIGHPLGRRGDVAPLANVLAQSDHTPEHLRFGDMDPTPVNAPTDHVPWWKSAVVYQIYPR